MELTLIVVIGVISIVTVAALSDRLGLAAPLGLVIVGIGLSLDTRIRADSEEDEAEKPTPDTAQRAQYIRLRLKALTAEHQALLAARSRGTYTSKALMNAQRALDLEATRIQQFSEHLES
ncbi:MAG TPA: hypothetical protein VGX23_25820 [Actinocrinis sp.]|nr:hypothetical protein [Actinocrinis sp.]